MQEKLISEQVTYFQFMFYRKYAILHRKAAKNNRKVALDGIDKIPGKDLDEYSPAMLRESGKGSSVLDE